jgi:hypothetical protein
MMNRVTLTAKQKPNETFGRHSSKLTTLVLANMEQRPLLIFISDELWMKF